MSDDELIVIRDRRRVTTDGITALGRKQSKEQAVQLALELARCRQKVVVMALSLGVASSRGDQDECTRLGGELDDAATELAAAAHAFKSDQVARLRQMFRGQQS